MTHHPVTAFAVIRSAIRVWSIGALPLLCIASCAPGSDQTPLPSSQSNGYELGAGDQVRVITYNEPQLSNLFFVSDSGMIQFPLIGSVRASGLTSNELASTIISALQRKDLLRNPSVVVEVTQYRPIFVLGEVNHPGQYPYQPGMTMLSAVALAGGFTYRAVTGYASDVRTEGQQNYKGVEGKVNRDTFLRPGDVITVHERYF